MIKTMCERLAVPTVVLAVFLLGTSTGYAQAATYYVRAGATGAQNGANWTDAFVRLPTTMVRGATYYVADGDYNGAITFNTANSGTAYIYIRKATISAHGTNLGWGNTYGDGVANFIGTWTITTSYWDFDGVTGGGPGTSPADWTASWTTGHGFTHTVPSRGNNFELAATAGKTNVNWRHMKIINQTPVNFTGTGAGNIWHMEISGTNNLSNVIIEYCYTTAFQGVPLHVKGGNNWLIQYTRFDGNGIGNDSNVHRETWSGINNDRFVWRWNYMLNQNNSAVLAFVNEGNAAQDIEIYGNIVDNDSNGQSGGRFLDADANVASNWKVFNNTLVGWDDGCPCVVLLGGTAISRNNILANHPAHDYGPGWDGTKSHNAVYNISRQGTGDVTASWASTLGSSVQTFGSDPFVNYANRDLRLKAATSPGSSADSPAGNAADMFGNARGADGVWDRGALEFGGTGSPPPSAPANLHIVP